MCGACSFSPLDVSFIFIATATYPNQRVAATAAHGAHVREASHMTAIAAAAAAVHCQNQRIVIHVPVHQKITAAPVAHQTETKAWMIRGNTLTPAMLLLF